MAKREKGLSADVVVERADWLFTPDELHLDGLETYEAILITHGLVDITTFGRFRPDTLAVSDEWSVHPLRVLYQTRTERSDQGQGRLFPF